MVEIAQDPESECIVSHMKDFSLHLTMIPAPPAGKLALVCGIHLPYGLLLSLFYRLVIFVKMI